MVDLFTDIPDDLIESTLQTIRENLDKQIQESAKRVRSIPFKITKTPEKEVIKKEDDYQIQGQLSIYDLEAS